MAVESASAAIAYLSARVGDEVFDMIEPLGEVGPWRDLGRREAVDLGRVEDPGGFGIEPLRVLFIIAGILGGGLGVAGFFRCP